MRGNNRTAPNLNARCNRAAKARIGVFNDKSIWNGLWGSSYGCLFLVKDLNLSFLEQSLWFLDCSHNMIPLGPIFGDTDFDLPLGREDTAVHVLGGVEALGSQASLELSRLVEHVHVQ